MAHAKRQVESVEDYLSMDEFHCVLYNNPELLAKYEKSLIAKEIDEIKRLLAFKEEMYKSDFDAYINAEIIRYNQETVIPDKFKEQYGLVEEPKEPEMEIVDAEDTTYDIDLSALIANAPERKDAIAKEKEQTLASLKVIEKTQRLVPQKAIKEKEPVADGILNRHDSLQAKDKNENWEAILNNISNALAHAKGSSAVKTVAECKKRLNDLNESVLKADYTVKGIDIFDEYSKKVSVIMQKIYNLEKGI